MARSYTLRQVTDKNGNPILNAKCEAYNVTTGVVAETAWTNTAGTASFTALPDAGTVVNIRISWGLGHVEWREDIFLEAVSISADHGGLGGLTDDDHTQYVLEASTSTSGYGFVVDEDDMTSNLDTKVPTQQSVKAYVDAQIGTAEEVADTVGAMVTGNTETFITVTYQDDDNTLDFVVPVKDEDDMSSDSATDLATQQSIKAYADTKIAKATLDADSVLTATTDNTPVATTMAEQTVLGRLTGGHPDDIAIGIADNNIVQVDQADVADNDFAKWTAAGLEGRSYSEVRSDLDLEAGTDFPSQTTFDDHDTRHAVGGADTIFPADPGADRYLMWDDDPGALAWGTPAGTYTHPNHSGDVTSVADGATTIANNAVTLAKLATQASDTFLANVTAGAAVPTAEAVAEQEVIGRLTGGHIDGIALGIADNNIVQIDAADVADNEYARFTAAGLESRTAAEVAADVQGSIKLDDLATPDANTDLNANTTNHGLLLQATAPAAGLMNFVGLTNGETAYLNKPLFDDTTPEATGTAAPGTQLIAARRDHVHLDPVVAHTALSTGVHGVGTGTVGSVSTANKTIYVDKAATGAADGTSWTDAFTTIQAAVDSLEDIILHTYTTKVRKGATPYREIVYLNSNPTVYPAHQILGRLYVQGEYYWYGQCQAIGGLANDLIANCDTTWVDGSGGDVTCTADTTIFLTGTKSAKMVVAATAGLETLAYYNTGALDISSVYTHISFWFYSTIALNANDLEFVIDEQTNLAMGATHEHLNIPAISANTWTKVSLAIGTPSNFNTLNSIGVRQLVDKGAFTFYVDDVKASVPGSFKLASGSDMTGVEVGDTVYMIDLSGGSSNKALDYFVSTVDDITGTGSLILGTGEATKNPSSTWYYTIVKTEISASDDGATRTRNNCISIVGMQNVYIYGFKFTLSNEYAVHASTFALSNIYGCYFENCTYIHASLYYSLTNIYYCYFLCNVSSSIGLVGNDVSYLNCRYSTFVIGTTGTTYALFLDRYCYAICRACYLSTADYGIYATDSSGALLSFDYISSGVTNGIYASNGSMIASSTSVLNNAITPKTPAAATDPAWIT